MFPTKILLAVDGSTGSDHAARTATRLSRVLDSELCVVLVGVRAMERDARERLEGVVEKIRASGGEISEVRLEFGRPDVEVVRLAEEVGAGMVVVGSRGLGGVRRMLLGSVSDAIVEHAPCPVMVVRAGVPGRKTEG